MEVAGIEDLALYAGSWSQWASDPARPIEEG
jgi:thiosulfate/3-mercaptopyruvate sulfurtransferase